MTVARTRTAARATKSISLRVRDDICALIDGAATAQGKTRSDFMIDAARRAAEAHMSDQTLIQVDQAEYDRFLEVLDHPPDANGFARLMNAARPWAS